MIPCLRVISSGLSVISRGSKNMHGKVCPHLRAGCTDIALMSSCTALNLVSATWPLQLGNLCTWNSKCLLSSRRRLSCDPRPRPPQSPPAASVAAAAATHPGPAATCILRGSADGAQAARIIHDISPIRSDNLEQAGKD